MATLTPLAGPTITVTAVTGIDGSANRATFSGSGFSSLPTITGVIVSSDTALTIQLGRIKAFA